VELLMNKTLYNKTMELARRADFCFWEDETWAPEFQAIDWSSDYDNQLVELVRLVVRECAETASADSRVRILERFGMA
jgi:hypothetical protein